MPIELDERATRTVLQRALSWCWVAINLSHGPADESKPTLHLGHMLVLSLEHINNCTQLLLPVAPEEVVTVGRSFVEEWATVRNIRNYLEHEEEYLVGRGRDRRSLSDESLADSPRGLLYVGGRAQALWVVGEKLAIPPLTNHVERLQLALQKWYDEREESTLPHSASDEA